MKKKRHSPEQIIAKLREAFSKALGLQRKWRYILAADVGALASRDTDGLIDGADIAFLLSAWG